LIRFRILIFYASNPCDLSLDYSLYTRAKSSMSYNWDDDDALMAAAAAPDAGPSAITSRSRTSATASGTKTKTGGTSFVSRARNAPDDDDDGDDPTRHGAASRKRRRADEGADAETRMEVDAEKVGGVYGGDDGEETEMQQLIRHWMNERHAPDILPAQDVLLGNLLDRIRRQVSSALNTRMFVFLRRVLIAGVLVRHNIFAAL
jgi:hypothetical protein